MFLQYRMKFITGQGRWFTYENGDFAALISKVERHLRRIGSVAHFGVVSTGIRTVAENRTGPSETDLNI